MNSLFLTLPKTTLASVLKMILEDFQLMVNTLEFSWTLYICFQIYLALFQSCAYKVIRKPILNMKIDSRRIVLANIDCFRLWLKCQLAQKVKRF